jgi:hypothetical protein
MYISRKISISLIYRSDAATLEVNLTQIQVLGQLWGSTDITNFYNDLAAPGTTVNPGSVVGNRMFYANDYMVRRNPILAALMLIQLRRYTAEKTT